MQETRDSACFGLDFAFSIISIFFLNYQGAGEPVWVCACKDWTLPLYTVLCKVHWAPDRFLLRGRLLLGGGVERISALLGTQDLQRY